MILAQVKKQMNSVSCFSDKVHPQIDIGCVFSDPFIILFSYIEDNTANDSYNLGMLLIGGIDFINDINGF